MKYTGQCIRNKEKMHEDKINKNKKCKATLYVRSDVKNAKGFHTYVLKLREGEQVWHASIHKLCSILHFNFWRFKY